MAVFRTADDVINQKIFEKSIDLILVTDRNGLFLRVSPSSVAILGYEPSEMIGHSGEEFLYKPDLENTRQMMRDQRTHGVTRHFDCRYVHRSGRIVILTWTGVWSRDEEQHFFIGRDITEARVHEQYKTIEEELEKIKGSIMDLAKKVDTTDED